MMQGKFLAVSCLLNMPSNLVNVNVRPAKIEVPLPGKRASSRLDLLHSQALSWPAGRQHLPRKKQNSSRKSKIKA